MAKQASIASFFGPNATKSKKKPASTSSSNDVKGKGKSKSQNNSSPSKASMSPAAVAKEHKTEQETAKKLLEEEIPEPPVAVAVSTMDLVDTDDEDEPIMTTKRVRSEKISSQPKGESETKVKSKRQKISELNDSDESEEEEDEDQKQQSSKTSPKDKMDEDQVVEMDQDSDDDAQEDEDYKDEDHPEEEDDDVDTDARSDIDIAMASDDDDEPLQALAKPKAKAKAQPKSSASSTKKNAFTALKQAPPSKNKSKSKVTQHNNITPTDTLLSSKAFQSWNDSEPAPYSILCETLSSIEAISSRLEIQKHLTDLFRLCLLKNPSDLITLVYLASNSVAAAFECVELGIGDAILIKAVAEASGSTAQVIKKQYENVGDLGTVAMTAKGKQRTLGFGMKQVKKLTAGEVLRVFRQIANVAGSKSQKWKTDLIKGLLVKVQGNKGKDGAGENSESKYIIRGLQGKLRIGLAQSTVLISLAHAVLLNYAENGGEKSKAEDEKDESDQNLSEDAKNVKNQKLPLETRLESAVNCVKKAYSEVSSFDALVDALLNEPLHLLNQECTLRPGMPVEPMLAKPTKSIQEVLKRLNGKRFTCEFKYDGERAQVHLKPDGVTKVFSRSLLDTSEKFPEVPLYVKEACENVESFVLDTEVVAYNRETKQFVPFQILSTRKKTEESDENAKVKVIVQAFDLMYLNGKSLLDHTLSERRDLMKKHFKAVDGKFQFATALDHTEDGDTAMLEEFLETAVKGQCEGLMVKTLDENASYQPSYRSLNWLKLKKDYLEGMGDSVDLVPIGAYHGRGKRTGVFGAYLLACYDVDTEEYQSVCKIGTGFSDEDLKTLSKGLSESVLKEKCSSYNVSQSLECDVWFDACQVWEVKAADLSKSSTHKGAIDKTGESGRGIGLRFPRFERLREDKRPDQATTSDQILDMYYAQDSIVDTGNGYADDDGI